MSERAAIHARETNVPPVLLISCCSMAHALQNNTTDWPIGFVFL